MQHAEHFFTNFPVSLVLAGVMLAEKKTLEIRRAKASGVVMHTVVTMYCYKNNVSGW